MTEKLFVQSRMDVGNRVLLFRIRESSDDRDREGKKKKKKRNRFYRCERRIEKGKSRSGRHNSIVFQKCGKNAGVTSGRHARGRFFHPFFFISFFLSSPFQEKWGKRCSHPVELIVVDLTPPPLLAVLSTNAGYPANIPD